MGAQVWRDRIQDRYCRYCRAGIKSMYVIAVDPGKTIGWAFADGVDNIIAFGQVKSFEELRQVMEFNKPDLVVFEAFKLYPWKAQTQAWSDMPAAQVIGALKVWCDANDVKYHEHSAAVMRVISDATLKALNLWEKSKGKPHARDALRHLLYYYWCGKTGIKLAKVVLLQCPPQSPQAPTNDF